MFGDICPYHCKFHVISTLYPMSYPVCVPVPSVIHPMLFLACGPGHIKPDRCDVVCHVSDAI